MKKDIVIYGAQGIALGTYYSVKTIVPDRKILCFLVTSMEKNASFLCGVPVKELRDFAEEYCASDKEKVQVLIATPENVMSDIEHDLEKFGFHDHVRLDSGRWARMQKSVCIKNEKFMPLEAYPVGFTSSTLHVYKAMFHKDKELKTWQMTPNYMIPIQVGASGTKMRVADVLDNMGKNISDKNGNYSELTGLYWIWKNRLVNHYYGNDCYYGLAHYRRLLELSDDDLLRLTDNEIDVVLPYPMPYEPDIEEHHKRYLSDTEWCAVLQALNELHPESITDFQRILKQNYFYNYNIILAKSDVLEHYCSWLFPILFRIEEINDPNGEKPPNRYIGYVGETLETLYFMSNKDKFRIVHTGCRFLT